MARLVLKLPDGLAKKVAEAADEADMLPTEWVRDLVRKSFEDESDEGEDTEGEPEDEA